MNRLTHKGEIITLHIFSRNNEASNDIKQKLIVWTGKINKSTIIFEEILFLFLQSIEQIENHSGYRKIPSTNLTY